MSKPAFIRDAAHAGVSEAGRLRIVDAIAANPKQGDEIKGSGGVRKVRVAGRGNGKSGGYRVMVVYFDETVPAYLLAILSKGDKANFSASEITDMKAATTAIGKAWQERRKA